MMYEQQQAGPAEQVIRMDLMKSSRSVGSAEQEGRVVDLLDMSGMSLHSLPNPSFNASFLHKLDLSNNYLQSIPESLTARLVNVVVLDVHSNQLKALPNSIGCLSNLKLLNVSANLLWSLPKSIEKCRSLEELNANFNTLTKLPDNLGFELINLKKLSVNSNKLVFLPSSTSYLPNLRILDARLNCLRSLPNEFENLIHLEILNISQNFQHLATLPYTIGLLTSLVELDVSYNKIKILPDSLGCLKKLQKLSAEGNPLISPPLEVVEQGLYKLKEYWNGHKNSPKKKSWIGKLRRYSTFNGPIPVPVNIDVNNEERQGLIVVPSSYNQIQTLASPRHAGRSLLSTKSCFT